MIVMYTIIKQKNIKLYMFSALFLDHCRSLCVHNKPCLPPYLPTPQNFDFIIDCHSDRYGIETVKGLYNRVRAIRILKDNGTCFEPFQQFSACQFHGAFFANIKMCDRHHKGTYDIVADMYDAASFPMGTLVLVNNCCAISSPSDLCDDNILPQHPCASSDDFVWLDYSDLQQLPAYTWSDSCIQLNTW